MAASAVVGLLRVLLTANTAEFDSAMKSVADKAKGAQRAMQDIGRQATAVGGALTKTFTLPLVASFGAATKAAIDFESSFAGVKKTIQGTEQDFAVLNKALRDLSKTIPVDVNELNRLAEAAGAMGIAKEDVVEFTRVMALLGVTTNVTSEQAAESIGKIQNIFNAAGKETDRFAATLVALGNDGASTESQILEMATRIAGAGNTIGLTQGQVLAFASALSSVGIEAEMGGSAISRVFIDIQKAVSQGGKDLEGFAKVAKMSVGDFSNTFKTDAAGAVNAFVTGLSKIKGEGGDLLKTLAELGFSEIRVRDTLLRAAGAGDLLTRALELQGKAWRENTALSDEANKRFETTESKLKLLWGRIKDVGITFGNALLPAINSVIGALDKLIPLLDLMARAFNALPGPVQATALGLLAVAAAAGPLLLVFGSLARSASDVIGIFTRKSAAAKLLGGSLGGLRTSAVETAGWLGRMGAAARGSTVLMGGLSAAVAGIAVPIALELIERRLQQINDQAQLLIEASKLVGREVKSPSEAARLKAVQEAGAAGQPIKPAFEGGAITAEEARLWEAARQAAGGYAAAVETVTIKQQEQAQQTLTNTGLTIDGAKALTQAAGATNLYKGGVLAIGDAAKAATPPVSALAAAQAEVAAANKEYAADLAKGGDALKFQIAHMKETGKSAKELADAYGVTESSVERYRDSLKESTQATEQANSWITRFRANAAQLETQLRKAAEAGVPMSIVLEEFGNQIETVANRAPILGDAIGEATQRAAEALRKADLDKAVAKVLQDTSDEARKLAADIIEQQAKIAASGLEAANAGFLAALDSEAAALRENLKLQEADQSTSLESRLSAIHHNYEMQRIELRSLTGDHSAALKIIDENERLAAESATRAWQDHVNEVRAAANSYGNIFKGALAGIPDLIKSALTGGGGLAGGLQAALSGLGGNLGGKLLGDLGAKLSNTLFNTFGQTFTSVLGTMLPGIGSALGALIGPLVGKLFKIGGPSEAELAGREIVESFESQLAGGLTAQQKLAAGNESWKLTTIAVRDAYVAAGKTAAEAEAAVAKLWASSKQGAEASELAVLEIQAVMDQAAAKQREIAEGATDAATAQTAAIDQVKAHLDGLNQEYDSLYNSIKDEAPEEVMGVVEQQTRARMAAIEEERKKTQAELEDLTTNITDGFQTAKASVDDFNAHLEDAIRDRDFTVRVRYVAETELPEPEAYEASGLAKGGLIDALGRVIATKYFPLGGLVRFQPRGTDTVPALLTPGELVLNTAQQHNVASALRAVAAQDYLRRAHVEQLTAGREGGGGAGSVIIQRGAFEGVFAGAVIDSPERVAAIVDQTINLLQRGGARQTRFRRAMGVATS